MSAINVHIEQRDDENKVAPLVCMTGNPTLGAAATCAPLVEATHAELTRSVWIRRSIEDLLHGRQYHIADGRDVRSHVEDEGGKASGADNGRLYFVMRPPFRQDEIPWMPMAMKEFGATALIGKSGKMACPTWDLPAGSPHIGGSCPGATSGQTVIPVEIRRKGEQAAAPGRGVDVANTICQLCYASSGNYLSPHVQIGEVIRYWWTRTMMESPAGRAEWIATVVRAIQGEMFPDERMIDPRTGKPIMPMRVHSSGDFFSAAYAEAWIEVANALPEVTFWAPTRTWAAPGWMGTWARLMPLMRHGNLIIRPSAYHTGDVAPSQASYPWEGNYLFNSAGTTALYKPGAAALSPMIAADDHGVMRDPRADWQCQTYALQKDEAKTCMRALAPDGKTGCRACWLRTDLRVNYSVH
jgi:hypothetical protein